MRRANSQIHVFIIGKKKKPSFVTNLSKELAQSIKRIGHKLPHWEIPDETG